MNFGSNYQHFQVFNRLNLSIQVINKNLEYEFLSDLLLLEINKSNEEMLGNKMTDVYPQLEGTKIMDSIQRCFDGEQIDPYFNEFEIDGEIQVFEVTFELKDEYVFIITKDVTKIKRSELKAIRLSNEIQSISKIGGWSFDLASQEIMWSDGMFDIFDEDIEKGPPEFEKHKKSIHPDDFDLWDGTVRSCIESGKPYTMRFRTVYEDGTIVWLEAKGRLEKDNEGNPQKLLGTCQNITELVELEKIQQQHEEIIKKQKLIESHHSKMMQIGEMSAGFAHEFNNPLAVIAGQARIIRRNIEEPLKVQKCLDSMDHHIARIKKIMTGLKKMVQGADEINIQSHSVIDLINNAIEYARLLFKSVDFSISIDVDSELTIDVDDAQIEQALFNLIANSIESVRENGWIKVFTSKNQGELEIVIQDSGSPISIDLQDKMFTPFFTTKEVGEGPGLGLGIALGAFQAHNGRLYYEARDGHPAFVAILPM